MRDIHGRYHATKPITESIPAWAAGCAKCNCGIVTAAPLTHAAPFYLERMVQALDKTLTFCDCRAGVAYRSALLNRRQALIEEARRDPRMHDAAQRNSHPDIEAARRVVHDAYEFAPAPPIHAQEVTPQEVPV